MSTLIDPPVYRPPPIFRTPRVRAVCSAQKTIGNISAVRCDAKCSTQRSHAAISLPCTFWRVSRPITWQPPPPGLLGPCHKYRRCYDATMPDELSAASSPDKFPKPVILKLIYLAVAQYHMDPTSTVYTNVYRFVSCKKESTSASSHISITVTLSLSPPTRARRRDTRLRF